MDRHGRLIPRDDKGGIFYHEGSEVIGVLILSLRGGNASDRRGNPSCLGKSGRVCLFGYWFTVDRHARKGLAMTKVFYHEGSEVIGVLILSLRGGNASD